MKAKSSVLIAFVAGAIVAATPFLLSHGKVEARGGATQTAESNMPSVVVMDSNYVYVLDNHKIFRFEKGKLNSSGTPTF